MKLMHTSHVPAGDGPFPTLLLLHGWGASAHDLLGLAPLIHGGEALVLCPQGPVSFPVGGGMKGYGWFPLVPGSPPDPEAFRSGVEGLRAFLDDALERYPVDRERLVVAGFSQGGAMAYALALGEPRLWSGLMALSSWLPAPLAEAVEPGPEHEGLPTLIVHGTRDAMLDVERARESREAIRRFGVALTYRELDMGHEVGREALQLILRWLDDKAFAGRALGSPGRTVRAVPS
jgi:phospholipase/carboxylesterase